MLRIYPVALEVVGMLQPVVRDLRRRDANLADQLDRCSTSVVLNICEGDAHDGAARRHKYRIALGEAREAVGALDLLEVKRLAKRPHGIDQRLDHVIGVLVKVTR